MNRLSLVRPLTLRRYSAAGLLAMVLLAGCRREGIQVYTAPTDKPAPAPPVTVRTRPMTLPQLTWKLPPGWRETGPGKMSAAGFVIPGPGGQEAQVTITPLPAMAGREVMIVNMWREQLGLEPLGDEEVKQQFQAVDVGGVSGSLFQITGKGQDAQPMRIITAMVHRPDASWFYKLSGEAALVDAQKPAFLEFLKSIQMKEETAATSPADAAGTDDSPKPNWQVPAQWKPLPAGQMQVARFAVPERGSAKADVFVSVFPSDTGGTLANVNRWRRQIGLGEVDQTAMAQAVSALDPANPEAKLIDMTNNNKRLIGAIVPREGRYWFYKLLGDIEAVAPEKEAFVAFAKSKP